MPLYDYDCSACGRRFESIHGVYADSPQDCPLCGSGPVRKAMSAAAVHFKGSGWAKKERRASSTSKDRTESGDTTEPGDKTASGDTESGSKTDGDGATDGSKAAVETKAAEGKSPKPPAAPAKSDD